MKFEIPIGPQHPALKEPISLRLTVEGEIIKDVDLRLGYNHRGIEKLAEQKTWIQNIYLMERICGICSHSHATCYVQAVEQLMEIIPPRRGLYIRYLVSELERVHSHLLWLGVAGHEAGFDSFFMYTWRDREIVMDLLELISGNRVHYAINTIGGVRRDLDESQKAKILEGIAVLKKRSEYYCHIGANEPSFVARIARVGYLSPDKAISLCAVGPTARASGISIDVRKDDPCAVYDELDFEIATATTGDVLGRVVVRIKELMECYKMIEQMVRKLPDGGIAVKAPRKAKPNEAVARYEAPRGENIHYIRANGTDKPERLKVRAPTLANYPATVEMLRHGFIADIPLVFAAIDPCICCAERAVSLIDAKTGEESVFTMSQLRQLGIEQHKKASFKRDVEWPL